MLAGMKNCESLAVASSHRSRLPGSCWRMKYLCVTFHTFPWDLGVGGEVRSLASGFPHGTSTVSTWHSSHPPLLCPPSSFVVLSWGWIRLKPRGQGRVLHGDRQKSQDWHHKHSTSFNALSFSFCKHPPVISWTSSYFFFLVILSVTHHLWSWWYNSNVVVWNRWTIKVLLIKLAILADSFFTNAPSSIVANTTNQQACE